MTEPIGLQQEKTDDRKEIIEQKIYQSLGADAYCVSDEKLMERIDAYIIEENNQKRIPLNKRVELRNELFYSFRGFGMLSSLLNDETISEIMVNNDGKVFFEKEGKLSRYEKDFSDSRKLNDMIQKMVAYSKRKVNESTPIVDARLEDGSRINIVLPPVAIGGAVVTIRKFPENALTKEAMIANRTLSEETAQLLQKLVEQKKNIFIFGGTGSGKTTLLNMMSEFIGEDERIITVEDSAELQIHRIKNLVRMEARMTDDPELADVTIRDLIKCALRQRPDRIVVGEVRGVEAFDMLNAMNTGHEGSLSTGHANSAADMLTRLEMMILSGMEIPYRPVQKLIASAIDYLVEIRRMNDGSRKVCGIYRLVGLKQDEYEIENVFTLGGKKDC